MSYNIFLGPAPLVV